MSAYLLIPDSFKGTLSAMEVCAAMKRAILRRQPEAVILSVPVADGGEGTVEAFLTALGGQREDVRTSGPYGEPMTACYGLLPDGTAVIEMAACAGLPLVGDRKDPSATTTFGVGELLLDAVQKGVRRFLLGLGGSATNDGGCGCAAACGARFYDKTGLPFLPTGGTLQAIDRLDVSLMDPRLKDCTFTILCDIDNPLCGPRGAAAVFAPQKGADPHMVRQLDDGLAHLAALWKRDAGVDVLDLPGGGAAGGMGAGMAAFFGGKLRPGIDLLLDTVDFDALAVGCDLILTGEGCLDGQTLGGKAVCGVAKRAKKLSVPVVAVVGGSKGDLTALYDAGLTAAFSINRLPLPLAQSAGDSTANIEHVTDNLLRLWEAKL